MPQATDSITTRRRAMLAGGAVSLFAGIATAAGADDPGPGGPDAALIAACAAFDALSEEFFADPRDQDCGSPAEAARDANDARITARQNALLRQIEALPACRTLAGARALARTVAKGDRDMLRDLDTKYQSDRLLAQVLRKLGAEAI